MDKQLGKRKARESSQPRITYPPHPPIEPFKSSPLAKIPTTPKGLQEYTIEELEEERAKIWLLHVKLGV